MTTLRGMGVGRYKCRTPSTGRIVNLESGWPVQVQCIGVAIFFPLKKAVYKMDDIARAAQFVIL
jgi:hypothetical protein